jgi:LPXTG-motif cell wall-anchored protein
VSPDDEIHVLLAPSYQSDLIDALPAGARLVPISLRDSGVLGRLWFEQTGLQQLLRHGAFDVLFTVTKGSRAAGANACDRARGGALFSLPTEASGAGPTTASPEASTPAPVFGGLAFTGADAAVPLAVGGFLVGLGLLLLFARRRKREPRE